MNHLLLREGEDSLTFPPLFPPLPLRPHVRGSQRRAGERGARIQQSGHFLQPSSFPAQDNMAECSWAHGQGEGRRLPGARQEITPAADLQLHRWGENGSASHPRLHITGNYQRRVKKRKKKNSRINALTTLSDALQEKRERKHREKNTHRRPVPSMCFMKRA